jgi:hypothetical protein
MGAGISLGEDNIAHIIERELDELHKQHMENLPPCIPQYMKCRNMLEDSQHQHQIRQVKKYAEYAKRTKTFEPGK